MSNPPFEIPDGWTLTPEGDRIEIQVETEDFVQAVDIIQEITHIAEDQMHHPDVHIESYKTLRIASWSHDIGGLSDRDEILATSISEVLEKRGLL